MVSHEERKKQRLATMVGLIDSGKVTKKQLIAECIIEWGMSERTVKEYIKVIEVKYGIFE